MQGVPLPDSAAVARALAEVYSRPELAPPRTSPLRELWHRFLDWLRSHLPHLHLSGSAGDLLTWTVLGLFSLLAVVILVRLGRDLLRGRERRERAAPAAAPQPAQLAAIDWEARARAAAAEGRWREAALALYQALLLRLAERGAVRYDPSKTPGDYRREARRGDAAPVLDAFLRTFEPVAFGGRPLDAAGYDGLRVAAAEGGAHG